MLVVSTLLSVAALGLGVWAHQQDRAWQTLTFLALTCLQLGVALGLRPVQLTRANPLSPLAIAGSFLLALAGVYLRYSRTC